MREIALVTGASAGFGTAIARILGNNGFDLIITGRRKERLVTLKEEMERDTGAEVLILDFDIRKPDAVSRACDSLEGRWQHVDLLVNNAGLAAGLAPIHEGDPEDWERMIDTNLKGLLYMTRRIAPGMVERGRGHIINIGSIAGREAYENGNVYNATKFGVEGLTQAMRIDLVDYGIKVTSILPGAAETEFSLVRFHGDREKADKVYEGYMPLHAEDVAEAVLFAATRPAHVNIDELLIMPTAQARTRKIHRKE
jgi:NADP-dependent 3-hydroxy acid dehydrogenase YdfG